MRGWASLRTIREFPNKEAPPIHPACQSLDELHEDVAYTTTRGSGPGGQHRNKTETAVAVTHTPTGIRTQAGDHRSQHANKRVALKRLRLKLAMEHRCPITEDRYDAQGLYEPTPLWQSRLKGPKLVISHSHDDFAPMLAEALDVLEECADDVSKAAGLLLCSTSQLVKFLAKEPSVLAGVNDRRKKQGLRPLR